MEVTVKTLEVKPQRALTELMKSISILEGNIPHPNKDCPFCDWHETIKKELK